MRVDRYAQRGWPEFHQEIPKETYLTCPECGAMHTCEVEISDVQVSDYVAHARIETDSCEGCAELLCSKCPGYKVDGLRFCKDCKAEAEECSKECGKPVLADELWAIRKGVWGFVVSSPKGC